MTDFIDQLKLAEKAQEDIYFARLDRRLIEVLRRKLASNGAPTKAGETRKCMVDDAVDRTE